jgi:hypothetical protein
MRSLGLKILEVLDTVFGFLTFTFCMNAFGFTANTGVIDAKDAC